MNDVFDALNCKLPRDGMRIGGKYYKVTRLFFFNLLIFSYSSIFNVPFSQVLLEFRHQLTNYIRRLEESPHIAQFASLETLVALQVTICSTLGIVEYLINDLGFSYVLTGKITQDCLEVKLARTHCISS